MYRIVHNEQTDVYRVEKRGLLGWAFVNDPATSDYLAFAGIEEARAWVRAKLAAGHENPRRWKIVADCGA